MRKKESEYERRIRNSSLQNYMGQCKHCKGDLIELNPMGFCDHDHYPSKCGFCWQHRREFGAVA